MVYKYIFVFQYSLNYEHILTLLLWTDLYVVIFIRFDFLVGKILGHSLFLRPWTSIFEVISKIFYQWQFSFQPVITDYKRVICAKSPVYRDLIHLSEKTIFLDFCRFFPMVKMSVLSWESYTKERNLRNHDNGIMLL